MITKGREQLVPHIDSRVEIIDNERPGASPCVYHHTTYIYKRQDIHLQKTSYHICLESYEKSIMTKVNVSFLNTPIYLNSQKG